MCGRLRTARAELPYLVSTVKAVSGVLQANGEDYTFLQPSMLDSFVCFCVLVLTYW